ncbi:unnamed protein product [Euphydryas editha]|uniref:Mutant cadherin n=1 Tax=Euphydryas editha TaxID=104508 RepID=A0AAU9V2T6_EUPED|nr:unnamed protein product [Euphydryas editha]
MTRIKCNSCDIIINEVLCFVQNKLDIMNNVSLALLCRQSFSEEDIAEAKSLLFESVQQRKIKRRGDAGKNKNIEDIIGLLKGADPEIFPTFVARDIQKLPPVSFDHIDATRLLKDILIMQREISAISEKCAVFQDMFVKKDDLKFEIEKYHKNPQGQLISHPYVNLKRGGSCLQDSPDCDSGPMGLMTVLKENNTSTMTVQKQVGDRLSFSDASACAAETDKSVLFTHVQQAASQERVEAPRQTTAVSNAHESNAYEAPAHQSLSYESGTIANDYKAVSVNPRAKMATRALVSSETPGMITSCNIVNADIQSAVNKQDENDGEWIRVEKRKTSRFKGLRGTAVINPLGKFRAAELQIPLFIYNVSKEATERDVAEYIFEKTQIHILPERVRNNKPEKDYTSFKFCIPRSKLSLFTNNELWPEDIYFRRYIIFKKGRKATAERDTKKNNINNGSKVN